VSALRLGIVIDNQTKQETLAQLINRSGHQLGYRLLLTAEQQLDPAQEPDAWVIDVAEDYLDHHALLEQLFAQSRVPIILTDSSEFLPGSDDHQAWSKRSVQRLQRLHSDISLGQTAPASELWILAASTGGPAAVKRFLARLPVNLGMAFLYVQHVDANQLATLNRMMHNAGQYPVINATSGAVLERNSLMMANARDHLEILDNGTVKISYNQAWSGDYAPSIDQVAANAARIYRARCGLIIFTGMGDDGAASSRLIKQLGGRVWVQTPSDCTSDSMPLSALATGCVSLSGTPEELADALARLPR
jgi:chemosensory pili system protein ChpB (putative protein-glutamate methylesterase)